MARGGSLVSSAATYSSGLSSLSSLSGLSSLRSLNGLKSIFTSLSSGTLDATMKTNLLSALGKAFNEMDVSDLTKVVKQLNPQISGKILADIPIEEASKIMKKLPPEDAMKIIRQMPMDSSVDVLKKMTNADASKILKKMPDDEASTFATKMGKIWDKYGKVLVIGGTVLGVGVYLDKKLKESKEKAEACTNTCLPSNWAEYKYGDLEKSKLKFSETKSTNTQPICTKNISDCGEYCTKTCTDIHKYEIPGTDVIDDVTDKATGGLRAFFETINPFNPNGVFGNTGWISIVCCILVIVGIILLSTM